MSLPNLTRRGFLAATGGLVVSFSLAGRLGAQAQMPELPGSLSDSPHLDSWIRISADGTITVFTGKAELGQGIKTAILQVAAEELEVDPTDIRLQTADTALTPNEGYTAGSQSMPESATAVRYAAANVRILLIEEAAWRLDLPVDRLWAADGAIRGPGGESIGYGDLASDMSLQVEAWPAVPLKPPGRHDVIGRSLQRVDIPAKVTGGAAYVQDLRFDDMLHARVVRPPSAKASLVSVDASAVEAMPGVVKIVRDGSFLAVVAEREFQAVAAMRALDRASRWSETASLPNQEALYGTLRRMASETGTVAEAGSPALPTNAPSVRATFTRPYQMHGSIGPSCAIGLMRDDALTIWSHTQGVYPDRDAIAGMLRIPSERVRVIHAEGAGCYGHNGADDAAADAALIARAVPGRHVRVQWTREQEHGSEPYGPAMVMDVAAALGPDGRISHWTYDLWSCTHVARPGPPGALLPARHIEESFEPPTPELRIRRAGSGDRNAVPLYTIPNKRILWHFIRETPIRVSALRALGAYANVFALESTMEELALVAEVDPVEFRLRHLDDPRARAVVEEAAIRFGWSNAPLPEGRGRGFAFAQYKNLAAYLAMALEATVDRDTGRVRVERVVAAIDSGEAVNPDGIRNQTEGGIVQSISWTLYEEVMFSDMRVTSIDWSSYPMLRFDSVPDSIDVHVIDRPGEPYLGTGEAAQGPTAAAIGNAIRHATGIRLTDLPLSPDRLRRALDPAIVRRT